MNDALLLLDLIDALASRIRQANALRRLMIAEGRDTLTAAELASLKADDDAARAALVDAIEHAKTPEA